MSSMPGSIARRPLAVPSTTGQVVASATRAITAGVPLPSSTITRGAHASGEVIRRNCTTGAEA
ncbi:hypothetical protein OCAE111667_19505 [Occultella aeris]|uniref:Uncharacterized protein n=1 Tax=Occultella aeris TaxID=2761496 RepID=A0A7M4DQ98_9MICO|nr:hypothetical protein HALOF300_04336 [Occultella aeris]